MTNAAETHVPTDRVELGYRRDVCATCGTDWPCPDFAQAREAEQDRAAADPGSDRA